LNAKIEPDLNVQIDIKYDPTLKYSKSIILYHSFITVCQQEYNICHCFVTVCWDVNVVEEDEALLGHMKLAEIIKNCRDNKTTVSQAEIFTKDWELKANPENSAYLANQRQVA